mmetsp:Transcript_29154/g.60991  ORF Transcript_29154/g.60991 Transcript_29154/m.60991 type:complete len:89 (-) Transcript_29154:183-449(-)
MVALVSPNVEVFHSNSTVSRLFCGQISEADKMSNLNDPMGNGHGVPSIRTTAARGYYIYDSSGPCPPPGGAPNGGPRPLLSPINDWSP